MGNLSPAERGRARSAEIRRRRQRLDAVRNTARREMLRRSRLVRRRAGLLAGPSR